MVFQQLVTSDVTLVHSRYGMVHQQMNIELRNLHGLSDRTIALAQIIAPLGQFGPIFLMLLDMTGFAIRREQPNVSLIDTAFVRFGCRG